MLRYDDPFKLYILLPTNTFAGGGAFWDEDTADTYNALRAVLLTSSYFFTGGTPTDEVQASYTRTQLNRTDVDYMPGHTTGDDTDYPPILLDIENWDPFTPHVSTDAEAFTQLEKARTIIDIAREAFPNRRLGWYGWTPDNNWYGVKNWLNVQHDPDDANYAARLSVYRLYQKENERVRFGGTSTLRNNRGPLDGLDYLCPPLYLPNDTSYTGSGNWYENADMLIWSRIYKDMTAEARRIWQKPIIPQIQPFKPTTTTYLGDAAFIHMLDVAYADPNSDGVMIYFPSAAGTSDFRATMASWVADNLL